MKPRLTHLRLFLQAGCNYTQGALLAVQTMPRFRDAVQDELLLLERELGIPLRSLRAAYLRSIRLRLEEFLKQYDEYPGAPTAG
jgi:hypothetical protein